MAYSGTPAVLRNCPICGSKDGRCRERSEGSMILCMGRPSGTRKERQGEYEFMKTADGGEWGIWAIPSEETSRIKQLVNDRLQIEVGQPQHCPDKQTRDAAYREILGQLGLAPADLADLEARGLNREQIEEIGFRSVEQGQILAEEVDWRIPGVHPSGRRLSVGGAGYLCPVRNLDGLIVAMQIRLRQPGRDPETGKTLGRYRWLSSRTKYRTNPPDCRISGEWPLPVVKPEGADTKNIWIVEGTGTKPAITAYRFGAVVIGAAGGQWTQSPQHLRYILKRLDPSTITLAPDAGSIQVDSSGQQSVLRRMTRLYDLLRSWGYNLQVAWWGQDLKPETQSDKRVTGDIDEISPQTIQKIEIISFDDLRQKAAEVLKAQTLDGQIGDIGRSMPTPDVQAIPEPELDADAPEAERLEAAVTHWITVEGQGNPLLSIPLANKIRKEFGGLTHGQFEEIATYLRARNRADFSLEHSSDVLIEVHSEVEQRSQGMVLPGIPCGFQDLDAMTQGFQRSDLIITAARPSIGKTSFVMNVARNVAVNQQLPVAVFSLEMSKTQLVYRLLSSEVKIETSRLRTGRLAQNEWEPLGMGIATLATAPIYLDDTPNIGVSEIRNKLLRLQSDQGAIGCVIIDYLQLMEGDGENRNTALSKITRRLKGLARELNVPIIALSQLSRGVESRTNKRPISSDLRDSGGIEQDADLIMMLYRDEYYDPDTPDRGIAEVIITKHRNGPTGTVKLLFEGQFTRFVNLQNTSIG